MLRRLLWAFVAVLLATLLGHSQATPGVTVTATMTDGQGQIQKTGYLHWQLWNCGTNVPMVSGGTPTTVVAQQFDMRPNPSTGLITGAVYGKNQIFCGNVNSTEWLVTQYKSSGQVSGTPQYYCLSSPGTFDPAVTQPCAVTPPPPGSMSTFGLFSNPPVLFTNALSATLATSFNSGNMTWSCWDGGNPANAIYPASVTLNQTTLVLSFTFAEPQTGYCVGNAAGAGVVGILPGASVSFSSLDHICLVDGVVNLTAQQCVNSFSTNTGTVFVPPNYTGAAASSVPANVTIVDFSSSGQIKFTGSVAVSGPTTASGLITATNGLTSTGPITQTGSGVFTNTQNNLNSTFNVNGINFLSLFQNGPQLGSGSAFTTDALTVGLKVPAGANVLQADAISGYVTSASTTTFPVALYGVCQTTAPGAYCWGANPWVGSLPGVATSSNLKAIEADLNVGNASDVALGINVNGYWYAHPTTSNAFIVNIPGGAGAGAGWDCAFCSTQGASLIGLLAGPSSQASNVPSQSVTYQSKNGGGSVLQGSTYLDPTGALILAAVGGRPVVVGSLLDQGLTAGNCVQATTGGLLTTTSGACGTSSGTITATGSPVSGNMAAFSGATSITNSTNMYSVPPGASSGAIQTILSAAVAGEEIEFNGVYTACGLTLTVANVRLRGLDTDGTAIQCATASSPVLTVSGAGDEIIGIKLTHITNSPTCPGGNGTATCGDGLQIAGGSTRVKVKDVHTNFNYNGVALGWTTYGEFDNSVTEFNNNHGVVFVMDATHKNMQWQVSRVLSEQNLGNGFDMTCPAAFTSVQTPGPYISGWTATFGNAGYGYKFSCSAATTSGIADIFMGETFASQNNKSGYYFDVGPNGGRNTLITGVYSEQAGTYTGTAGFAQASQAATNTGYGIEITSSCDPTSPFTISSGILWSNSYSGALASCGGTSFANVDTDNNGAAVASAQTEAGITINATSVSVTGGFHKKSTSQNYGVYVLSGDTPSIVGSTCDTSITAANCVFSGTPPASGYQQRIGQAIITTTGSTNGFTANGFLCGGATFTSSGGLNDSALTGGATCGKFTTATLTTGSTVITMGSSATAPHGWACSALDITHPADVIVALPTSATTITVTIVSAITAGDVIQFGPCEGY